MKLTDRLWIGPSMMCADQANLSRDMDALEKAGVDFFHFDIMDGNFVENLAMSPDVVLALRKNSKSFFDVHLMLKNPGPYIDRFAKIGVDLITVHIEANVLLPVVLDRIHSAGIQAGIALNPGTPPTVVEPFLNDIDVLCVMSVEPGFAGQKFIENVLPKINYLSDAIEKSDSKTRIEIDGNVTPERMPDLASRGVSMFVGGTSMLFKSGLSFKNAMDHTRKSLEGICK